MTARWMGGMSFNARRRSVHLYNLLGVKSGADVVWRGRLRWFAHFGAICVYDWVATCRNMVVAGVRCGRGYCLKER